MTTPDKGRPGPDASRLARLLRLSENAAFSATVKTQLSELLRASLGAGEQTAPGKTVQPVHERETPEQLELKIRSLVDADAPWSQIAPHAWRLFRLDTTAGRAARIVELAFLHGGTAEVSEALASLRETGKGFYREIHPAVRAHLIARFWREGEADVLAPYVIREKDEPQLQPIERLFAFHIMSGGKDPTAPFLYFRRHRRALMDAAQTVGEHVGLPMPRFLLSVGQMAIDLGYDDEARSLLEGIRPTDREYDDALRILLEVTAEQGRAGQSRYRDLLLGQHDYKGRLKLLEQFFADTRRLGGFRDPNRAALNDLIRAPFDYFTEDPDVFEALSRLLAENRDLEQLLPNLYELFRVNALRFHAPALDRALWLGPSDVRSDHPCDQYWRGVALLHHYVSGAGSEEALWEARDLVSEARRTWRHPVPFEWKDLHRAAVGRVTRTTHLTELERQGMLRQLRIASEGDLVTVSDIEEYVAGPGPHPVSVLRRLEGLAARKKAPQLEICLILKRGNQTHLTNADLERIWKVAVERRDCDLAWRAATILEARQSLAPQVRHAWQISGEKRSHYPFLPPSPKAVERCLEGLGRLEARLAHAVFLVGKELPELLAILDKGAQAVRPQSPRPDSVEARIDKVLSSLSWLGPAKKRYVFSFEGPSAGLRPPAFAQVLPANPWAVLVARLSERLGLNAWGWQLSRLSSQVADLIPRLASRQDLRRHSGKVARWLKGLSPEQRAAWQDLAILSRELDDQTAALALARFVVRIATVILQNHHQALTSLMSMRAPVAVIWDLETWLLSEAYTEIRRRLGTAGKVLVPDSLARLKTIVQPPA